MCKLVEIVRDAVPSNIVIEFERDASMRATEVLIINHDRRGNEQQGIKLICFDNGDIQSGVELMKGIDIV